MKKNKREFAIAATSLSFPPVSVLRKVNEGNDCHITSDPLSHAPSLLYERGVAITRRVHVRGYSIMHLFSSPTTSLCDMI